MKTLLIPLTIALLGASASAAAQAVDESQPVNPNQPVNVTAAARASTARLQPIPPRASYTSITPSQIALPPRNTLVAGDTIATIDANGTVHRRQFASNAKLKQTKRY